MRPLEIMVVLATLPAVIGLWIPGRAPALWMQALPFVAAGVGIAQILIEGYRWQMLPAYLLIAFLIANEAARWMRFGRSSFALGALALCFWLAAIGLSTVMPVFKFPAPTGAFEVGTEVRHLIDKNRNDPQSSSPFDPRELMIQIWYPVDRGFQGQPTSYRDKATTNWHTAQLALVKTHSYLNAPLSSAQPNYPVLIFSPSWSGQRVQNTFQVEDLASHGYIVVAMDHPYGTDVTVFPDGRIARSKLGPGEDYSSEEKFERFIHEADQQVKVRAEDARFVLDQLTEFNKHDAGRFTGHLDLDRVGIFGHSLGGSVAAQACWLDDRFTAGLDMDGMMAGDSAREGSRCPVFFMMADRDMPARADLPKLNEQQRRTAIFDYAQFGLMEASLAKSGGYRMVIAGTTHRSYCDSPFFSPLKFLTGAGSISTQRAVQVIDQYTLAFFDQTLKQQPEPLLAGMSPEFPEARLEVFAVQQKSGMNHAEDGAAVTVPAASGKPVIARERRPEHQGTHRAADPEKLQS